MFPLSACWSAVTGVSADRAKARSVLTETLARSRWPDGWLGRSAEARPVPSQILRHAANIDKLIEIDQSPIGRTGRSNPATYTGVFDEIRKVFAQTRARRGSGATEHGRRPVQLQHRRRTL